MSIMYIPIYYNLCVKGSQRGGQNNAGIMPKKMTRENKAKEENNCLGNQSPYRSS